MRGSQSDIEGEFRDIEVTKNRNAGALGQALLSVAPKTLMLGYLNALGILISLNPKP